MYPQDKCKARTSKRGLGGKLFDFIKLKTVISEAIATELNLKMTHMIKIWRKTRYTCSDYKSVNTLFHKNLRKCATWQSFKGNFYSVICVVAAELPLFTRAWQLSTQRAWLSWPIRSLCLTWTKQGTRELMFPQRPMAVSDTIWPQSRSIIQRDVHYLCMIWFIPQFAVRNGGGGWYVTMGVLEQANT